MPKESTIEVLPSDPSLDELVVFAAHHGVSTQAATIGPLRPKPATETDEATAPAGLFVVRRNFTSVSTSCVRWAKSA